MSGFFVTAQKRRFSQFTITITDKDDNNVTISAGDTVRVKIGRDELTPILDISSNADQVPSVTHCTKTNPTTVTIIASDLDFVAGAYNIEADVWDDGDSAIKGVDKGTFGLIETQTGLVAQADS